MRRNQIWMSVYGIYLAPPIIIGFATILVLPKGTTILVPPKGRWPKRRAVDTQQHAAAIVAVSVFESSYVGGFTDEPGYSATLQVPPELFDRARSEFHEPITAGCAAVVVGEPFLGVTFRVRRPPYDTDWVATIINTQQPRWIASERLPQQKSLNEEGLSNRDTVRDAGAVHGQ